MSLSPRASLLLGLVSIASLLASGARAQQSNATVSFTCDFPGSDPSHYSLTVTSTREASYSSDSKLNAATEADPDAGSASGAASETVFRLSAETTTRIFDLARAAHYFQGTIDSKKKNIASTGDKTLVYHDADKSYMANYNYSLIPAVQELTAVFQNLSSAVEFGRRLDYEYRYQKLALDEEMKRMEDTTTLRDVGPDLAAAAPVLQKIADDPSVINLVRARAMRLLQHAGMNAK
jgi:hypothetical protein